MKSEKETLVDSIFPKESSLKKMSNRKKLKAWAQASPFLALLAMLLMMWGFGPIGIIIGLLCGGSLIGVIITSVIMKKNGRDPSALLATAAIKPVMILIGLSCFVGVLIYLGRPEYISVRKSYQKNHPGKPFPKDEFFGFLIGETSFNEAEEILRNSGASFTVRCFEDTEIRSLSCKGYANGEIPIEHISLQFDDQEKIYSMLVWLDMKKLSEKDIHDVHRAFNYKYSKRGEKAFNPKEADFHFSSSGVEIYFDPDWHGSHIKITNLPKQKDVENFRRNAKLIAAKSAAEKFLPKNEEI